MDGDGNGNCNDGGVEGEGVNGCEIYLHPVKNEFLPPYVDLPSRG